MGDGNCSHSPPVPGPVITSTVFFPLWSGVISSYPNPLSPKYFLKYPLENNSRVANIHSKSNFLVPFQPTNQTSNFFGADDRTLGSGLGN
jgi:hypothetical protein